MKRLKKFLAIAAVAVTAFFTISAGRGTTSIAIPLAWDAPADYIPDHYTIYVNGQFHVDLGPYPTTWTAHAIYTGTYEFSVTAWRGYIESPPSNIVGVVVGKIKGKLAIVEIY